jgi:uncharacterized protein (DUF362 family)
MFQSQVADAPEADGADHAASFEQAGTRQTGRFTRRALIVGGSLAAAGAVGYPIVRRAMKPSASVFIARNQSYSGPLRRTIRDGLIASGIQPEHVRGRRVLLKPNLVEPTRDAPHMTTHPAVVHAAIEVFLDWNAEVTVGEGPGHVRDTEMAVVESGLQQVLDDTGVRFADLNYEDVGWIENASAASGLAGFYFPKSVLQADLIVSMPKMKTHHWVGYTASLKNLYGVIPGSQYGWPKNVLHYHGIPETVFDINASLPKTVGIVDGIDCMEGDGPIMGSRKSMGLIVVGTNLTALDATVGRLMQLDPARVSYLKLAADRLGPIDDTLIRQRGERWQNLSAKFEMLELPHLQELRQNDGALFS